jgi:hypothetical protein
MSEQQQYPVEYRVCISCRNGKHEKCWKVWSWDLKTDMHCNCTDPLHGQARMSEPTPPAPEDPSTVPGWWMCPGCNDWFGPEDDEFGTPPVCDFCKKAGTT